MRQIVLLLFSGVVFLMSFGCASSRPLGKLPQNPDDFTLPKEELTKKFPEIAVYQKGTAGLFGYCTPVDDVISQWGEPDDKKANWLRYHIPAFGAIAVGSIAGGGAIGATVGTGIVLAISPAPFQIYTWHKGNYIINANIDTTIFCGYMKRLLYWEWVTSSDSVTP